MDPKKILEEGKLIVFPTDTLYGLAASLTSKKSVEELYSFKKRDKSKPCVILASSIEEIMPYIKDFPSQAKDLAKKHWPGALTLVLPIHEDKIPSIIRAGLPTCGFRIPSHSFALQLLEKTGPLVVTSVNESGQKPCITREDVESFIDDQIVPFYEKPEPTGTASTVVGFENHKLIIFRQGSIQF